MFPNNAYESSQGVVPDRTTMRARPRILRQKPFGSS